MNVYPIPAFSDNYIWLIEKESQVIVVDPGESEGVLKHLKENELTLQAILLTHKHDDHVAGVSDVLDKYPQTPIYGPIETQSLTNHTVEEGDSFELMGETFQVFKTAGHTEEHISYLMGDNLFCGDALFSGGCGRVFTGDYEAQYDALQKFNTLDDKVQVFAAHEYTQTNLRFALSVESPNQTLSQALAEADKMRADNEPTLPSTIGKEKQINLFLKAKALDTFIDLRKARDEF
ncbi:hydroxyacylglutathione hydrolase [Alkalibacterium iburiense]|uniref:Hydroxyacylglutathione hydrolase n=1 Tax=Alkalibacterium iburiense TaxID=290589 RepID=A0ABN0XQU9_9LACT